MRLATYNVENLFDRAKAMNLGAWDEGKPVLEQFAALNQLLGQVLYTADNKQKMVALLLALGLEKSDTGPFVLLRRNKGGLLKRPKTGGIEIVAGGRADWVGSLELRDEPVNEKAMRNTARTLADVGADVFGVVEVESRPVLSAFNTEILPAVGGEPFAHVMVIDGNDERGIDVGLMSRGGFPIGNMRSHVDDRSADGATIFSRDCPEFEITTAAGHRLLVLMNHLKSKGYGDRDVSNAKRKAQSARIAEIYNERRSQGVEAIVVMGDFNDTPESGPLSPLLRGTDLKDIFLHPKFSNGGFPGTFGGCGESNKIDYILLSPHLFDLVSAGGVWRKALWPGVRPRKWDVYEELTRPEEGGSDHAAVWVDLDW